MRKVHYYEYKIDNGKVVKELQGEATFLAFGVDCHETDAVAGSFSTAILELDDGSVKNIYVENIKFIK